MNRQIAVERGRSFSALVGEAEDLEMGEPLDVYEEIIDAGWVEIDGHWLLRIFERDFHSDPSRFRDYTGYEAAANGRAIPDDDLTVGSRELAARGMSFARAALEALPTCAPGVTAFISVAPTDFDESLFTGKVTFCADHDGEEPYIDDLDGFTEGGIAAIRSTPA